MKSVNICEYILQKFNNQILAHANVDTLLMQIWCLNAVGCLLIY